MDFTAAHSAIIATTEDFTDEELFALNLAAQLGINPHDKLGYEKAVARALIEPTATCFAPVAAEGLAMAVHLRTSA
jgi:hypothetical protein